MEDIQGIPSLAKWGAILRRRTIRSADLAGVCVERIESPNGEGERTFLRFDREKALAQARRSDRERELGLARSPIHGLPISVKDLFDVADEVTAAGSKILLESPPATQDAAAVKRLRAAGAVLIGRTNMTEFAYSGLGLNPHHGTPLNPYDRPNRRIPGGSSSGAAVSVADGMACAALASDTGGSVRIPAAFCGLCGFKPSPARIPREGLIPLSPSFDSIGTIGWTVECCRTLDALLSRDPSAPAIDPGSLRLGVPSNYVVESLAPDVERAFDRSLRRLRDHGIRIEEFPFPELEQLPEHYRDGGLLAIEAYRWHRRYLETRRADYDPRVSVRMRAASAKSEEDYQRLVKARLECVFMGRALTSDFDALVLPTVPVIPPRLDELERDEDYLRINLLALRNTSVANFLGRCAVTIPNHAGGDAPTGFSLMGEAGTDRRLLAMAARLEPIIREDGSGPRSPR